MHRTLATARRSGSHRYIRRISSAIARGDAPRAVVAKLRAICLALPEASEEEAWVGTRWCVRKKNFAHVVGITDGWPPAYAKAAAVDGPGTVLTFRVAGPELDALAGGGAPFFKPPWFADIVGLVLDERTDWDEVAELITESYCVLAPQRLVALVDRPGAD
jgi:hypothetical protein